MVEMDLWRNGLQCGLDLFIWSLLASTIKKMSAVLSNAGHQYTLEQLVEPSTGKALLAMPSELAQIRDDLDTVNGILKDKTSIQRLYEQMRSSGQLALEEAVGLAREVKVRDSEVGQISERLSHLSNNLDKVEGGNSLNLVVSNLSKLGEENLNVVDDLTSNKARIDEIANKLDVLSTLLVPVGTIVPCAIDISDEDSLAAVELRLQGWLPCDGQVISPVEYPKLHDTIGTAFGGVEFRLPDLRGRVPIGAGTTKDAGLTPRSLGERIGSETHVLTIDEMPKHSHKTNGTMEVNHHRKQDHVGGYGVPTVSKEGIHQWEQGKGEAHNIMQPSLAITYIIKARPTEYLYNDLKSQGNVQSNPSGTPEK